MRAEDASSTSPAGPVKDAFDDIKIAMTSGIVRVRAPKDMFAESDEYVDTESAQAFRKLHLGLNIPGLDFPKLTLEDMPALFKFTTIFVAAFEKANGRPELKLTYGSFDCLLHDICIMFDEIKKLGQNTYEARELLKTRLQSTENNTAWQDYRAAHSIRDNAKLFIAHSIRDNAKLFIAHTRLMLGITSPTSSEHSDSSKRSRETERSEGVEFFSPRSETSSVQSQKGEYTVKKQRREETTSPHSPRKSQR